MFAMVIRFILPLLLAFGLVGQVVQPDPKALVPVQCAIVAVDPFGVPLSSIEVKINGVAQKIADSRVSLPQGRHTIEVSARGFAPISQAIDVTGSTQKLVFCLRVGSLFDRSRIPCR